MSDPITYITPLNGGISGGKIGTAGDTIFLFPKKMRTRFTCPMIDKTRPGDDFIHWQSSRYRFGTLNIQGEYGSEGAAVKGALLAMSLADGLAATVTLDTGHAYAGTLNIEEDDTDWDVDDKRKKVYVNMTFRFSGTVIGDGASNSDIATSGSGTPTLDLKRTARRVRGYQDTRDDFVARPFLITGMGETGTAPLDTAINAAVAEAGGGEHAFPGDSTLKFKHATAEWAGVGIVTGQLIYSRWVLDCRYHRFKYSLGYVTDGFTSTPLLSGSESGDDPCAPASEGFSVTFRNRVRRTLPVQLIYVPCVWSTDPYATVVGMTGKVNSNTMTLDVHDYDPITLRCDGLAEVERVVTPSGNRWFGHIKFAHKVGGWYKGKLFCLRMRALPLEGDQTLPSYTFDAAVRQLAEYNNTFFSDLHTICPNCY